MPDEIQTLETFNRIGCLVIMQSFKYLRNILRWIVKFSLLSLMTRGRRVSVVSPAASV